MEASLTRKESKKGKRSSQIEPQNGYEEGNKERKKGRKRDGKHRKKRSVPNSDGADNINLTSLGKDNKGLHGPDSDQADMTESGGDSVLLVSQQGSRAVAGNDETKPLELSMQGSEIGHAEIGNTNGQPLQFEAPAGVHVQSNLDGKDDLGSSGPSTHTVNTFPDQGLRRRATLTEIGGSFDEDHNSVRINFLKHSVRL